MFLMIKHEFAYLIKSSRFITFIILSVITLLLINLIYHKAALMDKKTQQVPGLSAKNFKNIYRTYTIKRYSKAPQIRNNLLKTDPIITFLFIFLNTGVPILLIFLLYPSISGEVSNNTFFTFIQFSGKTKYYLGKLFSTMLATIPILLVLVWISYAFNYNKTIPVDNADQIPKAIRLTILVIPYLILIISFIFTISSITKTTYGSLSLALVVYYILFVIEHTSIGFLSPTYFNDWIFQDKRSGIFIYLAATTGFILLFNSISLWYLNNKNMK